MKETAPVKVGKAELIFEARPATKTLSGLEYVFRQLGNRVDDVRDGALVTRTEETLVAEREIALDHSEAIDGEFVWACDRCGMYSKSRVITERHEQDCIGGAE